MGRGVWGAKSSSGIAANPYLQFPLVATESGELVLSWVDDEGVRGSERASLTVSA